MSSTVTSTVPTTAGRTTGLAARERSAGTETRIFMWCCFAIAAHILIDAYIDLRPGTSPTDHLVSGTVPAAVLTPLVYVFIRVRAGQAAMIAIQLGVATVLGGIAPVALLIGDGRMALSPITGGLAMFAGLVLIGLGPAMLWRSRRRDGRLARRSVRRIGWTLGCFALFNVVAVPIGYAFAQANWSLGYALDEVELGPDYERVDLETADGLTLAAAYRRSTNGAAVIVFPGRKPGHEDMFARHGFGVMVLEPRGRNDSQGDPPFVWNGEEDLKAAVRYLQSRPDVDEGRVGGFGGSHGGLLIIQTAANEPGLRAVVSEGGTRRTVSDHSDLSTATFPPFGPVATAAMAVFSNSLPPPPIPELIAEIAPRPIMLIWALGEEDLEWVNTRYHERAGEPKTIWNIPESGHVGGLEARPDEYEQRVMAFFDKALLDPALLRADP